MKQLFINHTSTQEKYSYTPGESQMNKYYVVCFEKWDSGVRLLPRIEYTTVAESREAAIAKAENKYPQYSTIDAWEAER